MRQEFSSISTGVGTFVIESRVPYRILDCDSIFCDMTGYTPEELSTKVKTFDNLLAEDDFTEITASIRYQLSVSNSIHIENRFVKNNDELFPAILTGQAFYLNDGREVLKFEIVDSRSLQAKIEITTPVEMIAQTAQNDLEIFANTVPSVLSKHLLDNRLSLLWANNAFSTIYGYSANDFKGNHGKSALSLIYREDLSLVINALADLTEEHDSRIVNYRVVCADGSIKWVNAILARSGESQGNFPIVNMVVSDITNLKVAEMKAALEEQKYMIISDISEEIAYEYDIAEDTLTFAEKFTDTFPIGPVFYKPVAYFASTEFIAKETYQNAISLFARARRGDEHFTTELLLQTKEDGYQWYTTSFSTIYDEDGTPLRVIGLLRNIHAQKIEQQRLTLKAETDQMTKLLNKVTAERRIDKMLSELDGNSYGVFMLIDIDNFKSINDTFGHIKGDEVIIDIANAMMAHAGEYSYCGRIGGDEFCIALYNVLDVQIACERAALIAEKLRKQYPADAGCPVTLSIGIASSNEPIDYKTLLERADTAVYHAKVNGKDQYCVYYDDMEHVQYKGNR